MKQLLCYFILSGTRARTVQKRVKVSHPQKCDWFLMACCLSFSAWQHLSSLNTLWNAEKLFGCLYDSGICSGGAVYLFKYSPKGDACFLSISYSCWPKQKRMSREGTSQKPGWVLAEVWLILTRQPCQSHFQNAGLQTKCRMLVTTLLSFSITLSLSQFQSHPRCCVNINCNLFLLHLLPIMWTRRDTIAGKSTI